MKPGDRMIRLRSPGRSFLTGWTVLPVSGAIVRVCRRRLRIHVNLQDTKRLQTSIRRML